MSNTNTELNPNIVNDEAQTHTQTKRSLINISMMIRYLTATRCGGKETKSISYTHLLISCERCKLWYSTVDENHRCAPVPHQYLVTIIAGRWCHFLSHNYDAIVQFVVDHRDSRHHYRSRPSVAGSAATQQRNASESVLSPVLCARNVRPLFGRQQCGRRCDRTVVRLVHRSALRLAAAALHRFEWTGSTGALRPDLRAKVGGRSAGRSRDARLWAAWQRAGRADSTATRAAGAETMWALCALCGDWTGLDMKCILLRKYRELVIRKARMNHFVTKVSGIGE